MAYFLLALMIYPAYMGLSHFESDTADEVVSLTLTSTRGVVSPVSVDDKRLVILFRINGAKEGDIYIVSIISENGQQLYGLP